MIFILSLVIFINYVDSMKIVIMSKSGNKINNQQKTHNLFINNRKLVPFFAKPYIKKHNLNLFEKQELIQEGNLGFLRACQKYDENKGKISTYGSFWIKRYMSNYIKKNYNLKNRISSLNENIDITNNILNDNSKYNFSYINLINLINNYPLTNYEKNILYKRYILNEKVLDIAKEYNLSRNTITNHFKIIKFKMIKYKSDLNG